jgi:diguanylate cyclase (GGDEF)-like protein
MPLSVGTPDSAFLWYALAVAVALVILAVLLRARTRRPLASQAGPIAKLSDALKRAEENAAKAVAIAESAREETRWARRVAEIGTTIDLDEVLARTLKAANGLPGVDAAIVAIETGSGEPLVATSGMSVEEVGAFETPRIPRVRGASALAVYYRYTAEDESTQQHLLRDGVVLPLTLEDESIGSLAVFSRVQHGQPSEPTMEWLAEVAGRSASAIRNAQQFRAAHEIATLDLLTALYNRRFFDETLERELARANRYGRPLALLLCGPELAKPGEWSVRPEREAALVEMAASIRHVIRSADVACRVGDSEFGIVLPESTLADGERLYRRLNHAVSLRGTPTNCVEIWGSVAQVAPSDTPLTFYGRAAEARERAKGTGGGQIQVAREEVPPASGEAGPNS